MYKCIRETIVKIIKTTLHITVGVGRIAIIILMLSILSQ